LYLKCHGDFRIRIFNNFNGCKFSDALNCFDLTMATTWSYVLVLAFGTLFGLYDEKSILRGADALANLP